MKVVVRFFSSYAKSMQPIIDMIVEKKCESFWYVFLLMLLGLFIQVASVGNFFLFLFRAYHLDFDAMSIFAFLTGPLALVNGYLLFESADWHVEIRLDEYFGEILDRLID